MSAPTLLPPRPNAVLIALHQKAGFFCCHEIHRPITIMSEVDAINTQTCSPARKLMHVDSVLCTSPRSFHVKGLPMREMYRNMPTKPGQRAPPQQRARRRLSISSIFGRSQISGADVDQQHRCCFVCCGNTSMCTWYFQVKGMEIEVRSMKGNERRQCQSRANQCRADLKSLRKSIEQVMVLWI